MAIRYDNARLSKFTRTANGGLKVRAVLTKTGVFEYRNIDGSIRKEYRPESELMREDVLDGFGGLPVTVGHPGLVHTGNWKQHAVGHSGDTAKREGKYAVGTLYIQDSETCAKIERGDLKEVSLGYHVEFDATPGEVDGQRYDGVQRAIKGNHIAIGPVGWGRAGRDVALRLDSNGDCYTPWDMADENTQGEQINAKKVVVRVDGAAEIEKLQAQVELLQGKLKEAEARADSATNEATVEALVASRVQLHQDAIAHGVDIKGKSPREIKAAVILSKNPSFRADGKSDLALDAAYEMALTLPNAKFGSDRAPVARQDGDDPIEAARKKNLQSSLDAHKAPLTIHR